MVVQRFGRNTDGVVAIEFAMIAPIIIFAIMAMADVGLASYDRMKLTAGVRSAAQYVMMLGEDPIIAKEIVIRSSGLGQKITGVEVNQYCACSGSEGMATECTAVCADGNMTNVYTRITAVAYSKQLLKTWNLKSDVEVRKR